MSEARPGICCRDLVTVVAQARCIVSSHLTYPFPVPARQRSCFLFRVSLPPANTSGPSPPCVWALAQIKLTVSLSCGSEKRPSSSEYESVECFASSGPFPLSSQAKCRCHFCSGSVTASSSDSRAAKCRCFFTSIRSAGLASSACQDCSGT